ncbi:hypothetical protein OL309_000218 [Vibrio parahaemolyticus]|nr:hypothetical protein [Vibrio parahaemolyticus]HCE4711205.1 hypothetical protein [Vibrio parahaemolyticus]HCG9791411.1 hypothetical protein [Vibrio parahaemolyticus]HCH4921168.1 hypothetical protein [Vibrio parahaemolyticus]
MSKIIENITSGDLTRLKNIFIPAKIQHGTSVIFTGVFQVFHQDYGIGKTSSEKLKLTPKDIRQIRKIIKEHSGFDILIDSIPTSRIEMAKYFPNEKLSTTPVKDKMVKVFGILSTNINGKKYDLEDGMNIELPLEHLTSIEHRQVVIVENYEAFSRIRSIQSDMAPNPLVIYRGDKEGGVISKEIAKYFPHIELVAWFDTDPSGISLALASGASHMLIPSISREALIEHGNSTLFKEQYRYWERVSKALPSNLEALISGVEKGITQESIIANSIPLVLHSLR